MYRIRTQRDRLIQYVNGELESIPELTETILPYWEDSAVPISEETNMAHVNSWIKSITVNRM